MGVSPSGGVDGGALLAFFLSVVVAVLNPSLKFLVGWSFGLFFAGAVAVVVAQTWTLLTPGDCPGCGWKMKLPPSEFFRDSSYQLRTIKFTCPHCGHVADSGIQVPWLNRSGGGS